MNWLNKLERKIGRYAVPNLIIWLIGAYTIGYVFGTVSPGILSYLTLSPYHILHGQIWRLVTWVFMPTESNLIFLLIMALFYYQLGMALERTWGTFRFNVYIFGGMIFTVIGAFVLYGIYYAMNASVISQMPALAAQLSYSICVRGFFHKLYQYVHFSGVCSLLSEYGVAVVFYHTDQGQMVWDSLRSFHCPFLPSDKLGWKSGDHCIHVQFHPVFPDDEKL